MPTKQKTNNSFFTGLNITPLNFGNVGSTLEFDQTFDPEQFEEDRKTRLPFEKPIEEGGAFTKPPLGTKIITDIIYRSAELIPKAFVATYKNLLDTAAVFAGKELKPPAFPFDA
ncbi:MAG: hypothetical protein AAB877_00760, partial [Patescibacteria group bacterium]